MRGRWADKTEVRQTGFENGEGPQPKNTSNHQKLKRKKIDSPHQSPQTEAIWPTRWLLALQNGLQILTSRTLREEHVCAVVSLDVCGICYGISRKQIHVEIIMPELEAMWQIHT